MILPERSEEQEACSGHISLLKARLVWNRGAGMLPPPHLEERTGQLRLKGTKDQSYLLLVCPIVSYVTAFRPHSTSDLNSVAGSDFDGW